MGRAFARLLRGYGVILIYAGHVLAGLVSVLCIALGVVALIAGKIGNGLALVFVAGPLAAGAVEFLVSAQGAFWLHLGERMVWEPPPGTEKLDRITRRAMARDPAIQALWEESGEL
jgi:hypothetical protein